MPEASHGDVAQVMHRALLGHATTGVSTATHLVDAHVHAGVGELHHAAFDALVAHHRLALQDVEQVDGDGIARALGQITGLDDGVVRGGLTLGLGSERTFLRHFAGDQVHEAGGVLHTGEQAHRVDFPRKGGTDWDIGRHFFVSSLRIKGIGSTHPFGRHSCRRTSRPVADA